ncbi:MAG TPA: ankyrin repeat domain-containing protein, partial [Vicinamibacteria bacterium]|nr:ankyrin repeat domain-containing protein [Vicinamibacteria bacterium]
MRRIGSFWVFAVLAAGLAAGAGDDAARGLAAAAARGDTAQVAALVRQGADPDAADRSGWTGLHLAAETGDVALARLLLDAGAHPDLRSRARGTPLDVAERGGRVEVARLLRLHGARGSGKSIGDTVCVRPWGGDGYCAVVEGADPTRYRLRVSKL